MLAHQGRRFLPGERDSGCRTWDCAAFEAGSDGNRATPSPTCVHWYADRVLRMYSAHRKRNALWGWSPRRSRTARNAAGRPPRFRTVCTLRGPGDPPRRRRSTSLPPPNASTSGLITPGLRPGPRLLYGARRHAAGSDEAPTARAFTESAGTWIRALPDCRSRFPSLPTATAMSADDLAMYSSSTAVQAWTSSSSTGRRGPILRFTNSGLSRSSTSTMRRSTSYKLRDRPGRSRGVRWSRRCADLG